MLFSKGGCTQGFNTFLTALKGGVLNPFGTNKERIRMKDHIACITLFLVCIVSCNKSVVLNQPEIRDVIIYQDDSEGNGTDYSDKPETNEFIATEENLDDNEQKIYKSLDEVTTVEELDNYIYQNLNGYYYDFDAQKLGKAQYLYARYFETEESLTFTDKRYVSSNDGTLKAFSWYTWNGGTASDDDSILQYRMSNGKLKAIPLDKIIALDENQKPEYSDSEYEYYGNLTWMIYKIELLKESNYSVACGG
jgi:hypothetical protein